MSASAGVACGLWLLLSLASTGVWTGPRRRRPLTGPRVLVGVVVVEVVVTAAVAWVAATGPAPAAPWGWVAVGLAAVASLLCGGRSRLPSSPSLTAARSPGGPASSGRSSAAAPGSARSSGWP